MNDNGLKLLCVRVTELVWNQMNQTKEPADLNRRYSSLKSDEDSLFMELRCLEMKRLYQQQTEITPEDAARTSSDEACVVLF